jgi:hypothetical protein
MTRITTPSASDALSLEAVLRRLVASPAVDGVAEFGSRSAGHASLWSDYDLLILMRAVPAPVFQMVTTIDGRLTDIVLVDVATADSILTATGLPEPQSFAGLFAQKMRTAQIVYDASGRLHKVKQLVAAAQAAPAAQRSMLHDAYADWFWLSFGLLQLERMASSHDPVYQTAVDMMLSACLPGAWRAYFACRALPWEGEKAAVRYWEEYDTGYLGAVRQCLGGSSRTQKLAAYRVLVEWTLGPSGRPLEPGETALILQDRSERKDILAVLAYWDSLFGQPPADSQSGA